MTESLSKKPAPGGSRNAFRRILLVSLGILVLAAGSIATWYYLSITKPVIDLKDRKHLYFYIHTGAGFPAVLDSLVKSGCLTDPAAFAWLSKAKHYDRLVRPGRYRLVNGMTNNALVNLLRAGIQEPVKITIQNVNTAGELAGRIGRRIEADSAKLSALFRDREYLSGYGLTPATLLVLFIPDTYEFWWNTSGDQLFKRMQKEYDRFWTQDRRRRADSLQLSPAEVVTLASIVEKESNKNSEKPVIAGVYLNRLRKTIPLQADPTVIFAWNDYRIRRVFKYHTEIKSPYNTYYRAGLPPGPICLPSVASVDAVLHAARHKYIYFCAREDLSGFHSFAESIDEHNRNAKKYQRALNKMNIR